MKIKKLLGKRIQEIRKSKKITQELLAENVEVDVSSISNIENGKYFPTADNLDKIMQTLSVEPQDLFNFVHLNDTDLIIEEMLTSMQEDERLLKLMYKFYKTIKYNI